MTHPHTNSKNFSDLLFNYQPFFMVLVIVPVLVMSLFIPQLKQDLSLKTMMIASSGPYLEYDRFVKEFGDDEFVFVAIKNNAGIIDKSFLHEIDLITTKLQQVEDVTDVLSITNFHLFQQKGKNLGNFPVIAMETADSSTLGASELENIRKAIPLMDRLISSDQKTVGIIVQFDDRWKYDNERVRSFCINIQKVITSGLPSNSEWKIVGGLIIRDAVVRYGLQSVIILSVLGSGICFIFHISDFQKHKDNSCRSGNPFSLRNLGNRTHGGAGMSSYCNEQPCSRSGSRSDAGVRYSYHYTFSAISPIGAKHYRSRQRNCQISRTTLSVLCDHKFVTPGPMTGLAGTHRWPRPKKIASLRNNLLDGNISINYHLTSFSRPAGL